MLKCYIVDDEQNAVDALAAMLKKKFAQQVIICGSNIKAGIAIEEIDVLQPDVLFLDVEMSEMTGLELLKHFPERNFHVIFTTAHEKYALPALKAAATDYLVKPLSPQEVYDALQKCIDKKSQSTNNKTVATAKININTTHEMLLVDVADIVHIEANNNYSHFYFTNRPKVIVSKTLKEFEEQLTMHNFFRVHQSHLINLQFVEAIKTDDGDYALLKHGHRVEISRRKKAEFMQKIKLG
jgi:two-component system, LytTR family, response regulator